jgi:PAS domain S-box-containing protein
LKPHDLSDHFSLGLRGQVLLIVFFTVALEVCIFSGLQALLTESEREAKRLDRARANLDLSNRLIEQVYLTAKAGQTYWYDRDEKSWQQFERARGNISALEQKLEQQVMKDSPEEFSSLSELSSTLKRSIAEFDRLIYFMRNGQSDQTVANAPLSIKQVRSLFEQVNNNLARFCRVQREVEVTSPEVQRRARGKAKLLLVIGVAVNVILALALAFFFIRKITNRLQLLVDNTRRLSRGLPLNPAITGRDELAELDRVFHEMAAKLEKEGNLLRTSEAQVRNVIERMPVGLLILRQDGTIEFANPYITEILGHLQNEIRNLPLSDVLKGKSGQPPEEFLEKARLALPGSITEVTALSKSGKEHHLEISFGEFSTSDGKRDLVTLIDVSERHEIQKLRQAFVSMVSHELRTPLTSVKGYLSLIDMGALGETSPELRDGARASERNINRLIGLINELLDLEKLESGRLHMKKASTTVKAIFEQALDSVKVFASDRGIKIDLKDDTHGPFQADVARIAQVLVNLLSNAIKFSDFENHVLVTTEESEHFIEFSVQDHGPGIDAQDQGSIFERFHQIEKPGQERKDGSGLGLAISKAIVEEHGGEIGVKSEKGKGSCFWFKLPKH